MRRLLALVVCSLTLAHAQPADLTLERELVRRALGSDFGPVRIQTELFVGQLPPNPIAPFPALAPARVIGSVMRQSSNPDYPSGSSTYLDTPLSPTQVRAQLQDQLTRLGWTRFPQGLREPFSGHGGFVPSSGDDSEYFSYYRLEDQVTLQGQALARDGATHVTLSVQRDRNLREQLRFVEARNAPPPSPLPELRAPAGVTVEPRGGGGGSRTFTSTAGLRGPVSLAVLARHFEDQLRAAGWTRLNQTQANGVASSTWTARVDDVPVLGVFALRDEGNGAFTGLLGTLDF